MKEVRMRNGDVVDAEDAPACERCGDELRTERGVPLCAKCYDEVGDDD
jgi:hypothetical protein